MRTEETYNSNISVITCDPESTSVYGIKRESYLNVLNFFLVTEGLPPDLAHDIFEGVAIDVILHIVSHFISENVISIDEVNYRINNFDFS